ncbi:MAG: hypothetical protein WDN24_12320 [Sphingomonas sp.]
MSNTARPTSTRRWPAICATDRLYQSLRVESNGAGGYRCVDVVARASGCVPLNLFTGKS